MTNDDGGKLPSTSTSAPTSTNSQTGFAQVQYNFTIMQSPALLALSSLSLNVVVLVETASGISIRASETERPTRAIYK
jgi:hypothetical protein